MRNCPADHELLPLVNGEPIAPEIRAHVDACSECRQRVEKLKAELGNLRAVHEATTVWAPGANEPGADAAVAALAASENPGAADKETCAAAAGVHPRNIGKYVVVSLLDAGGQADVYRAVHPTLGKDVVIKLSHKTLPAAQSDRDRLVAEGKLLAELDHPNLARVYDLDVHENRVFFAMEFVPGQNLAQHAKLHRLTPRKAAELVAKLARALAVAHNRGIIHQDIKPKNVLIDHAGQPRLIDFGVARLRHAWAEDREQAGSISGTPEFMVPEQANGQTEQVNQRSDIFGLGALLYYLLVGKAPFAARDRQESLIRASTCDFDKSALRSRGIPRKLARVC